MQRPDPQSPHETPQDTPPDTQGFSAGRLMGEVPALLKGHRAQCLEVLAALRRGECPNGPIDLSGERLVDEDLSGLDLTGARLVGCDLARANLENAVLFGADLSGANLFHARMANAELTGARLIGANLQGADLSGAGLGRADLSEASLVDADLRRATLVETKLIGADLRQANLSGATARAADWTDAALVRANLHGTVLDCGILRRTRLDGADLRHAHLRELRDFRRASWLGVDIREIDFTGAYLCRSFIHDQNYLEEFRRQSAVANVVYQIWWLTSDCGRSILRWSLCTALLIVFFAWLYTTVHLDYGPYRTDISPLYHSVVTMTTLGYGDIIPVSTGAKVVAMLEVFLGYVMLGGLLSIFSNKMARRAD